MIVSFLSHRSGPSESPATTTVSAVSTTTSTSGITTTTVTTKAEETTTGSSKTSTERTVTTKMSGSNLKLKICICTYEEQTDNAKIGDNNGAKCNTVKLV